MSLTFPLSALADAPRPGAVMGVLLDRTLTWAWVVGQNEEATHIVVTDRQGMPRAWRLGQLDHAPRLYVVPACSLVLTLDSNDANPNALRSFMGCLQLNANGLLACVAGAPDNFGGLVPMLVRVKTGQVVDENPGATGWLTHWSLCVQGADGERCRLVGNPQWPDGAREQR